MVKKLTGEQLASILVMVLGAAVAIVGASNDLVYEKLHLTMNEYSRAAVVLLGVVVTMVGALKFRGGVSGGPSDDKLTVDLKDIPQRKADTVVVSYSKSTVDSLLDAIYVQGLAGSLPPHSYGRAWIVVQDDGRLRRDLGSNWASVMLQQPTDQRSLGDAGIYPSAKLGVMPMPKHGLMISAGRFQLGAGDAPQPFAFHDIKTVGNLLNRICHQLLKTQKADQYGKTWMLMHPDSGTYFDTFSIGDNRDLEEAGLRPNMFLEVVAPPTMSSTPIDVPVELTWSLLERSRHLGKSSLSEIMEIFEEEAAIGNDRITQRALEAKLKEKYGPSDLFYRLEVLRLLGFLKRNEGGVDEDGRKQHFYEMSPTYREEVYSIHRLDAPSSVVRRRS